MYIQKIKVETLRKIEINTYLLEAKFESTSPPINPGQFYNIKVSETDFPLLRRPFSVCDVNGDSIFFMFDIVGEGTKLLSQKKAGDYLDVLGPLGNGFDLIGDYELSVIVAGGIGAAPFPFLIKKLQENTSILSFIGGRTKSQIIKYGMKNIFVSTDDGTEGFHGTVIDLLKTQLQEITKKKFRIFACGPNPMLKALQQIVNENNYDCQISTECAMACGFGICQGCPIERADDEGYYLVCKDGPVFNANEVKL